MVEPTKFAPRKKLLAYFEEGWRLLPGHDYQRSDWAILVYMPIYPKPVSAELMQEWVRRFQLPSKCAPRPNIEIAREWAASCAIALAKEQKAALLARYEAA